MLNKILISVLFFTFALGASADEIQVNPDHPDKYTVVKGDTLWDISARFLEQPWRWPEIWNVNPQIADPNLIYPGDTVSLSYKEGMPVLNLERGSGQVVSGRNVKLSPQIRSSAHEEAITTIPVDAIQQFLERPLVLDDAEMQSWPYIVSSYDEHLIAGSGNTIYIRGIPTDTDTRRYSIYRQGPPYINPVEGDILGYEAIYVGDAVIDKLGDPASAVITGVDREVLIGDRLIPQSDVDISAEFIPRPPANELDGQILSVVDGVSQIGQYQIVVLNLGVEQGVEPGNVLGIFQSGKVVTDRIGPNIITQTPAEKEAERLQKRADSHPVDQFTSDIAHAFGVAIDRFDEAFPFFANKQARTEQVELPEEYVGVAMVFRTFNKVSYALVMETQGAVHVLDAVRSM